MKEREQKKTKQERKINATQRWFFKKNKTEKPLARGAKQKKKAIEDSNY